MMANIGVPLNPEEWGRKVELLVGSYRPQCIIDLEWRIEMASRSIRKYISIRGKEDSGHAERMAMLNRELSQLYVSWVKRKIT